jgi:hypothetical protein
MYFERGFQLTKYVPEKKEKICYREHGNKNENTENVLTMYASKR